MKILLLRSNPRKYGHTQFLTDLVIRGASDAGAEVTDIDLCVKNITDCIGCYACWTRTPGRCIHTDDMSDLLSRVIETDMLLCATPLYNYTMSSSMKRFFERTLPLLKEGITVNGHGLYSNRLRYPDRWEGKKLAFISTCAFKGTDHFRGIQTTFSLLAGAMNMAFSGGLVRPESFLLPFAMAKPKTVKSIETGLIQAGMELAASGCFSETTREKIAAPLTIDATHYRTYSAIYWEHVMALEPLGKTPEEIRQAVARDVRILMHEMARTINPLTTAKLKAVIQFEFPDKGYHYCITVNRGACVLEEKSAPSPDLLIRVDSQTWARIFTYEISMKEALLQKKISVTGEKSLLLRLDKYFPPPDE